MKLSCVHILFVWGWGGGVQARCGGGGGSLERKGGGEQTEAKHNNCSCVQKRGSSNMRAIGRCKVLRGVLKN